MAQETMQGRWWTWATSEPEGTNPVSDETGAHCAQNQPADVWFLAGTFGGHAERRCSVPAGRPIVLPALNLFDTARAGCAEFMDAASGTVELDGAAIQLDRIEREAIAFDAAADNPLGMGQGRVRATGCGLWARIPELSPGSYHLSVRGASDGFSVSVDYTLTVAAH